MIQDACAYGVGIWHLWVWALRGALSQSTMYSTPNFFIQPIRNTGRITNLMDRTTKTLFAVIIFFLAYLGHRVIMLQQHQADMQCYIEFLKRHQSKKLIEQYDEELDVAYV